MPLLSVRNLKKSFTDPDGRVKLVLDIPNFEIEPGQETAIKGLSGSGKTTLLNIIAGILKPDSGQIRISGSSIFDLSESKRDKFRAKNIGYIFQTFNLLQGFSALENVCLGSYLSGRTNIVRSKELLNRVGLADRLHYKPNTLSTGQQQRVAVARALVNKPPLVIADEPTGNLDPDSALNALGIIRNQCRDEGAALLLVSHDPRILSSFSQSLDLSAINLVKTKSEKERQ